MNSKLYIVNSYDTMIFEINPKRFYFKNNLSLSNRPIAYDRLQ